MGSVWVTGNCISHFALIPSASRAKLQVTLVTLRSPSCFYASLEGGGTSWCQVNARSLRQTVLAFCLNLFAFSPGEFTSDPHFPGSLHLPAVARHRSFPPSLRTSAIVLLLRTSSSLWASSITSSSRPTPPDFIKPSHSSFVCSSSTQTCSWNNDNDLEVYFFGAFHCLPYSIAGAFLPPVIVAAGFVWLASELKALKESHGSFNEMLDEGIFAN